MARKGESIFKRKDGRWEGHYIKDHRNYKTVYGYVFGKTYMEEKKANALKELSMRQSNLRKLSIQPTMEEIANGWVAELKPIRKDSTIVKYQSQLGKHFFSIFGFRRMFYIYLDMAA